MVVYIPMIAATTLLIWLAKHVKRNQRIVVLIMAIAIPVTVATLRYNNGADYLMYLRMMKLAEQTGSSATAFTKIKSIESGYWLLLYCYMAAISKSSSISLFVFCVGNLF